MAKKRPAAPYVGSGDDLSLYAREIAEPARQIDSILAGLDDNIRQVVLAYLHHKHYREHLQRHAQLVFKPRPGPPVDLQFKLGLIRAYEQAPNRKMGATALAYYAEHRRKPPKPESVRREITRIRKELREWNRDK